MSMASRRLWGCSLIVLMELSACGGKQAEPRPTQDLPPRSKEVAPVETMRLAGKLAAVPDGAGEVEAAPGVADTGDAPQVGAEAPALVLTAASGDAFDLDAALEEGPVVVVFYRGDWCPHCRKQLEGLAAAEADFRAKGASIVAVSVDAADTSAAFAKSTGAKFPILVDPNLEAIRAWGVEHVGEDIARPASFVVGADGEILFAQVGKDAKDRAAIGALLAVL